MKILFVIDALTCGGKERRLTELMKSMKAGTDIDFEIAVMNRDIHYKEIFELGVKIHYMIRKSKKDFSVFRQLYKISKNYRPDIIHCWDSMTAVYSAPVSKMLGIKLVNSMVVDTPVQQNIKNKTWLRGRLTFPFSTIVTGNSLAGLKAYKAPSKKSLCIYNGFNFDRINGINKEIAGVKAQLGLTQPHVVGMVAAFEDRKDYSTFIAAAKKIIDKRGDCIFLLIGEGDTKIEMMRSVPEKYKPFIQFTGKINNVEEYVSCFDIGVLCTNTRLHQEGVSNAILEYMALGKPVIATTGGGTNEIIKDGETGYIVTPFNADEVAEKIEKLLNNADLKLKMGASAKERVIENFSIEKMTSAFIKMYYKLLSASGV